MPEIERRSGTVLFDIAPDHAIDSGLIRDRFSPLELSFPSKPLVPLVGGFQSSLLLICRVHARGTFRGHNSRTGCSNGSFGWIVLKKSAYGQTAKATLAKVGEYFSTSAQTP